LYTVELMVELLEARMDVIAVATGEDVTTLDAGRSMALKGPSRIEYVSQGQSACPSLNCEG